MDLAVSPTSYIAVPNPAFIDKTPIEKLFTQTDYKWLSPPPPLFFKLP